MQSWRWRTVRPARVLGSIESPTPGAGVSELRRRAVPRPGRVHHAPVKIPNQISSSTLYYLAHLLPVSVGEASFNLRVSELING
jgi:hypothetical protein